MSRTYPSTCMMSASKMYSFLLLACAVFAGSSALMAQATALSSRTLSVSTFATGGVTNTDYSLQDHGLTFGTDLTHYYRLVQPSLEVRSTMTSGSVVRQRTLSAGLKLEKGYRALHPYGDFLVGYGVISFPQNTSFPRDNSTVWTYGGGVEYQISRSFLLKADIQQQSWKPGVEYSRFTPTLMTVGFSYRPFRRNVIR